MTDYEQEIVFIDLIQHYPFLYDKKERDFKDNNKRNNAWDAIASAMGSSVEELQKLWKNIMERYVKERANQKNISSSSEAPEWQWPLYKYMGFMEKHIASRKRVTNVSRPPSSCSGSSSKASTPLISPVGDAPSIWNTYESILSPEEATQSHQPRDEEINSESECEASCPLPKKHYIFHSSEVPSTSKVVKVPVVKPSSLKSSVPKANTHKLPSKKQERTVVEDTLQVVNSYLKSRQMPDKNLAFGQYVGLTLNEMPLNVQNEKKIKIVQILNEPYDI